MYSHVQCVPNTRRPHGTEQALSHVCAEMRTNQSVSEKLLGPENSLRVRMGRRETDVKTTILACEPRGKWGTAPHRGAAGGGLCWSFPRGEGQAGGWVAVGWGWGVERGGLQEGRRPC